jgi:hypothetical protein
VKAPFIAKAKAKAHYTRTRPLFGENLPARGP